MKTNVIHLGDIKEKIKAIPDNSIDAVVTDPPYELGFMGNEWDSSGVAYDTAVWSEVLRVLKPGGHLLAFGGTRTYHRMACAIEDAGFQIRDQIQWLYGSGFPKSQNISKGIDKKLGTERKAVSTGKAVKRMIPGSDQEKTGSWIKDNGREYIPTITEAGSELAEHWEGWGTGLKPANEPICMARKPLSEKSITENVMTVGVGGINIDDSRIVGKSGQGRWPANVILDEHAAGILDEQTGELKSGYMKAGQARIDSEGLGGYQGGFSGSASENGTYGDKGGASRFFYCAKAGKKEKGDYNTHPTVKPLKLMEYLIRLITPKGGLVLDPFSGSGTTLVAAVTHGFEYIGIELEEKHVEIANQRLSEVQVKLVG